MGMASAAMEQTTFRFCWSLPRKDVPSSSRRTFKVARVQVMNSITSELTISRLHSIFATHGLPQQIVTDNGPTFTSEAFKEFTKLNGIKHTFSAPYHPSSNGLAERAVQTFKQSLRQMQDGNLTDKIAKFLFKYRITPHTTTGVPPAELLMGRKLRSRLDLMQPSLTSRVQQSQMTQKKNHDTKKPYRQFAEGDLVYAENFSTNIGTKWLPGKIDEVTGPLSYVIKFTEGNKVRRHVDHIKARESNHNDIKNPKTDDDHWDYVDSNSSQSTAEPNIADSSTAEFTLRRSARTHKPPERYNQSTSI